MPVVTQTLEHVHITFPCPCSLSCIQIKSLTGRRWWIQSHSRRRKFCHYGFLRLLTFSVLASCTSGNSKTFCWALILKCPPQSCWCCTFRPLGMLAAHWPSFFHWGKFKAAPPLPPLASSCPGAMGTAGSGSPALDRVMLRDDATQYPPVFATAWGQITHYAVCWLSKIPTFSLESNPPRWILQWPAGIYLVKR